jgi:predicted acylesterase/phospholipase RssA
LSSYSTDRNANDDGIKICEAACATSAAASFFDPVTIGRQGEEYADGATGANNPIRELWAAAKDLWPSGHLEEKIKCIISVGTGRPSLNAFGQSIHDVAKTLLAIATETEHTAEQFHREHRDLAASQKFFRFSVDRGLEAIGLEEFSKTSIMVAATKRYLESQAIYEQMLFCRETLKSRCR